DHLRSTGAALERLLDGAATRVEDATVRSSSGDGLFAPVAVVHADEQSETVLGREVEDVRRRKGVHANRVEPRVRHRAEIALNAGRLREELAVAARRERAVGRSADPERLPVEAEELPVGAYAQGPGRLEVAPFVPAGADGRNLRRRVDHAYARAMLLVPG